MGTVILADVSELETIKISELAETLSTGVHDVLPVVKDGKTQKVKKPNLVHTQNTDTKLDEGGANEIDVTEIPKKATANITYYVATDGNDTTGDGTAENEFATIQHAVDSTPKILNGYYAEIRLKDGDYDEGSIEVSNFIDGEIYIQSASYDKDLVLIKAPIDKTSVFSLNYNSANINLQYLSVRIQRNNGSCIRCRASSAIGLWSLGLGDNGNTGTTGVYLTESTVSLSLVADINANKVSTGITSTYASLAMYHSSSFGDTFTNVSNGGIITDGIVLNKADYDDAITKKHAQGEDTALGAQSEDLDMNTHKIINVVDPVNNQDVITKLFASNMAINGGGF